MFEHFTEPARSAVALAQEEAQALHHGWIGTEHLLLGVLREGSGPGSKVLSRLGIALQDVRDDIERMLGIGTSDSDLLDTLGIDLDEVRRRAEDTFGPGALDRRRGRIARGRCGGIADGGIPFTPNAKKALELSLREATRLHHHAIGSEHLVLGLAFPKTGLAEEILRGHGVDQASVRAAVAAELGSDEQSA